MNVEAVIENEKGTLAAVRIAVSVPLSSVRFESFWPGYRLWLLWLFCLEKQGGDVPEAVHTGS